MLKVDQTYRIKRSAEQEEQMKYLTELKVFQSYAHILTASAIIGYANQVSSPVTKNASDGVLMQFFSEKNYDLFHLLAYATKKEQSVLTADDNEKYNIFEEYAHGGFPILVAKLGIDFDDKSKNNRLEIMRRYYTMLLTNDIYA